MCCNFAGFKGLIADSGKRRFCKDRSMIMITKQPEDIFSGCFDTIKVIIK